MKISPDPEKIEILLTRGVDTIYPTREALEKVLHSGNRIRLYTGWDPTAGEVHIGHTVVMRKLRQFQDLGHELIFLLGTFTATLGDPTGKLSARKAMTLGETIQNAKVFLKQAGKVIRFKGDNAARVEYNHKWLSKMSLGDLIPLASHFTVQQMLERDMFQVRMREQKPVYVNEFLYPLMQGYDSVAMDVDLEVGATDQTFNMLAGRTLQKAINQKEKFVLTVPLLTDASGKKIGKTEGNIIGVADEPNDLYGKVMSLGDEAILKVFELCTDMPLEEIEAMRKALAQGTNPRDYKAKLAFTLTTMYNDEVSAKKAEEHFNKLFREHTTPDEVAEVVVSKDRWIIVDLLIETGLASSKSDARRLIEQGGIKVDEHVLEDASAEVFILPKGVLLQRGKRQFVKVIKK